MSTYPWVCHPVVGDGEEPPAWPAHPRENQFLPPSWEWMSVLRENRCEIGTVGCSCAPTPKKGLLSQLQQTQVVFSLRPLRCSSPKAGPQDSCVSLLLSVGLSLHKCWRIRSNSIHPHARGSRTPVREGWVPAPGVWDLPCVLVPGVTQQP